MPFGLAITIRFLTVDFDKALQATGVFGGHLVQNHRSAAGGQIIVAGDIAKCAVAEHHRRCY